MFGLDVIFQIIFTVESFLTKVTLEAIVEAAAVVDVTVGDDIQAFTAMYQQFSKNHYHHSPHIPILAMKPKTLYQAQLISSIYLITLQPMHIQLNISGQTFKTN